MATGFSRLAPLQLTGMTVRVYESETTGLRAMLLETGEPLCSLHVVIGTESDTSEWTHKDDGLPHTLEHAIFLGSELYPYKGVLDKLANRCLADGTNAWTATDHTCYTMQSAGHEGCLNLLSIYADHILYPTLSDECFLTEVHHVTGDGENKGVVYCEMQGRENTSASLVDGKVLELLYPNGGYSAETGGKMANLRSLTNEQVRRYHRENYRPDNVMVILSGTASEAEFLRELEKVEERIQAKGYTRGSSGFDRPWSHPVPPMSPAGTIGVLSAGLPKEGQPVVVEFPSEEESTGVVSLGWRGPAYHEHATWAQLSLLWSYLTDSAIAPLSKALVEVESPLCSRVSPADEVFSEGYHQVWFRDAKCDTIDKLPTAFFDVISEVLQNFDLDRMHVVIRRRRRKVLEALERSPSRAAISHVIEHFLYGPRGVPPAEEMATLASGIDKLPHFAAAERLSAEEWVAVLKRFVVDRPCVAVVGRPSAAQAKAIDAAVKERQAATCAAMGAEGLAEAARKLQEAVAFNEREIPAHFLNAVPVPSYASIRSIPVLTIRGGKHLDVAPNSGVGVPPDVASSILAALRESRAALPPHVAPSFAPFWTEWAHVDTAFVTVAIAIDTASLSAEQRLLLPLYLDTAFKLPCELEDGTLLPKDDFVSGLQADTVRYGCELGLLRASLDQAVSFNLQLELGAEGEGFALALQWLRRALYLTRPSATYLKMAVQRHLAGVPAAMRNGRGIASVLNAALELDTLKSNRVSSHPVRQQHFLNKLLSQLGTSDGAAQVIAQLADLRTALLVASNMNVFVATNLTKLSHPFETLAAALLPPAAASALPLPEASAPLSRLCERHILSGKEGQAAVVALSAIETNFLCVSAPGLGPYSEDHAALLVAVEHLTALEGDFWVKLRGAGLTYSYFVRPSTDTGRISFGLFKCTDLIGAYTAARKIIVDYASGASTITELQLEGAKSTVAYTIISSTSTRLSAAATAWEAAFEGKGVDYGRWLLSAMDEVSVADVLHAIKRYIVPIFDASSNLSASCPPNKLDTVCQGLESLLGLGVRKLHEEELQSFFGTGQEEPVAPPAVSVTTTSAFAFSKQFKCECPKCQPADAPSL